MSVSAASTAERFREGAQSHFGGRRARTKYPAVLRDLAVQFWETERRRGIDMRAVAKELGVEVTTLRAWATSSRPTMRPVVVQDDSPRRESLAVAGGSPHRIVQCPNGISIEGLSVDDLVALVRGLVS